MRLRRLDLTRYGRFTGQTLDFGPRVEGQPDIHIVYGPNEAGKSTAFAAFLDLLFGIEAQSRYNFLHPYPTMQIGACLELSSGARELVRLKRAAPSLRDGDNTPLGDGIILGELGGLDRAAYRTMFSLDDETLEAGGEGILASKGELGQLLFSASAGLAELGKTLAGLRAETESFHKGARSGELAQLKAALAALKAEREAIDTVASDYNRMAEERDRAAAQCKAASGELRIARTRLSAVRQMLAALPRMAALVKLRAEMARLVDVPGTPEGWLAELPRLEQEQTGNRTKAELGEAEVARLSAEEAAIVPDEKALGLAGSLGQLAQLQAEYVSAKVHMPLRRRELGEAGSAVEGVLRLLGQDGHAEAARLLLPAAQIAALRRLIETQSGIESTAQDAASELADAVQLYAEAQQAVREVAGSLDAVPAVLTDVKLSLAAARDSDHVPRLRIATRAIAKHAEEVVYALTTLAPWTGDAAALAVVAVPDAATARGWEAELTSHVERVSRLQTDADRAAGEWAQREAECEAIGQTEGLVSDHEAGSIRTEREAAWAEHRRTLDTATADAFEAALRRDDMVGSARIGHERSLAKLHETAQAAAARKAETAHARTLFDAAAAESRVWQDKVAAEVTAIHPRLTVSVLAKWLDRREAALVAWGKLREAERDMRAAQQDAAAIRQRLLDALAAARVPYDPQAALDAAVTAGQAAADSEARVLTLRGEAANREQEIKRRARVVQKASQGEKEWHAAWAVACGACWLGPGLTVDAVRASLASLADLAPALRTRDGLAERIRGMTDDQAAFEREVGRIAGALGAERDERSWLDFARALTDRIDASLRTRDAKTLAGTKLVAAQDAHRQVVVAARVHAIRVGEMMTHCRAGSLLEVQGVLRDGAHRTGLERQAREAEAEILTTLAVRTLVEAEALLAPMSQSELESKQSELASELEGLDQRAQELLVARTRAMDRIEAVGGDGAVARIEERRRTKLLEIEDKAGHYLRLRVGIAAADRALRSYRDQHQSAMMAQASDVFRLISRGAYRGLSTQPDRERDILVAVDAKGGSKLATDLSKGALFQLYLALRAAGYREFARSRQPVPFIADDIMETFDDSRTEAALRVFAEMAQVGQVIYLTHHNHVRLMAERVIPSVRVHHLAVEDNEASPLPNRALAG